MTDQKQSRMAKTAKDLEVYQLAYGIAMEVFEISRSWPREERYALTDQVRRCSRAVCANLREAWAKRRYPAHFISKLTDADAENSETDTWLDFAKDSGCLSPDQHECLSNKVSQVGRMLGAILRSPNSFCHPSATDHRPPTTDH